MPLRRKSVRRRSRRTFKKFRRSFRTKLRRTVRVVKQMASAAYTYQNSLIAFGSNSVHSDHSQIPTATGNALVSLTVIPQGTSEGQRSGNRVFLKRLWVRGYTFATQPARPNVETELQLGRIIIWIVRDNDGEALGASGSNTDLSVVLENMTVNNTFLPPLRPEMRGKIRILADIKLNMMNTTIGNYGGPSNNFGRTITWKRSINLAKYIKGPTTFTNFTGSGTGQEKNHVYMAFIQTGVVTLAGSMTSHWVHRISYLP